MNADELAEVIEDLLRFVAEDDEDSDADELHGASIRSFRRAGVLTRDAGFTIELVDGSEYQVTVLRSKGGRVARCEECGKQISSEEIAAYRREAGDSDGSPRSARTVPDENAP